MSRNQIIEGDSAQVLLELSAGSVDLIVTDSPYLVNKRDRDGRKPVAFAEPRVTGLGRKGLNG